MRSLTHFTRALWIGLALQLIAGCDVFSTRDPEPPDGGRSSFEVPVVPADVIVNLGNALFERNAANYLRSFDPESFEFLADNEALSRDPALQPWIFEDESNHINHLFSQNTLPAESLLLAEIVQQEENIVADTATILVGYEITAEVAVAGLSGTCAGTARFDLRISDQNYWQIYRWTDMRTESGSTWSDLKSIIR